MMTCSLVKSSMLALVVAIGAMTAARTVQAGDCCCAAQFPYVAQHQRLAVAHRLWPKWKRSSAYTILAPAVQ